METSMFGVDLARTSSDYMVLTFNHGGGNELIWGCMNAKGVGEIAFINCSVNASLITQIMNEKLTREAWRERNFPTWQ